MISAGKRIREWQANPHPLSLSSHPPTTLRLKPVAPLCKGMVCLQALKAGRMALLIVGWRLRVMRVRREGEGEVWVEAL